MEWGNFGWGGKDETCEYCIFLFFFGELTAKIGFDLHPSTLDENVGR